MSAAPGLVDVLRPSADQALAAWAALVRADNDQVDALPNRPRAEDFYAPVAEQFRADPRRANEPVLDYLRSLVRPDETWLDLGAGGGRYTLPLALLAKRVYAVEPSAGMRAVLTSAMAEHSISNVDIFEERWPHPSNCPVADVGFMSQVGYDIADIGPFLDQLEAQASRVCIAVLFERAPVQYFAPLWRAVHDEDRVLLPGLREMVALLFARGRVPEITLFETTRTAFESVEQLHRAARRPTWVVEGSDQDERLRQAVAASAIKVQGGYALSARPRMLGVVRWRPRD